MSLFVQLTARPAPRVTNVADGNDSERSLNASYENVRRRIDVNQSSTASTFCASTTFGNDSDQDDRDK